MESMKPAEALEAATLFVCGSLRGRGEGGRPGEVIERLPASHREALARLKSSDIGYGFVRNDLVYWRETTPRQAMSEACLEFDRKVGWSEACR